MLRALEMSFQLKLLTFSSILMFHNEFQSALFVVYIVLEVTFDLF